MPIAEIEHSRRLIMLGQNQWKGVRSFLCNSSSVKYYCESYWDNPYPGFAGSSAPRARRIECTVHPFGWPANALIMVYYETARTPGGKAKLAIRVRGKAKKKLKDLDGEVIEGPDFLIGQLHAYHWQVVKGDNVIWQPHALLKVETAEYLQNVNVSQILGLINHINSNPMPNLGNAVPRSMLYLGCDLSYEYGDTLIYQDHYLMYSADPNGWNGEIESQMGSWVVQREPVLDGEGNFTADTRDTLIFKPARKLIGVGADAQLVEVAPESRRIYPEDEFSFLGGLIFW